MPNVQNYPSLASEADDFMTLTPDPELTARAMVGSLTRIMTCVIGIYRSLFHTSAYWRTIDDLARAE
jgi:hypothetical protein